MKRFIVPVFLLLAYLVLCSKSCDREEEENRQREEERFDAAIDRTASSLERDVLSDQALQAFGMKAMEKLLDFADYLKIYSSENLDDSFREQTGKMIRELFVSDTVPIKIEGVNTLKDILATDFRRSPASGTFTYDSVHLLEPLKWVGSGYYKGSMGFIQRLNATGSGSGIQFSENREADIFIRKVTKRFGKESVQVWQVYLGGIR